MKTKLFKSILILIFLLATINLSYAIPFPWLDYGGTIDLVDGHVNSDTYGVRVYGGKYLDGTSFDVFNPNGETIIGAYVWLSDITLLTSGSTPRANAMFHISEKFNDATTDYLTAEMRNIYINSQNTINPSFSANLFNIVINNSIDSRFLDEFQSRLYSPDYRAATRIDLAFYGFDFSSNPPDLTGSINVHGKLAPVPEPATLLLFGSGLTGLGLIGWRKRKK